MKPHTTSNHFDFSGALRPVQKYAAPAYPTLSEARENPALLEKLPSRWQDNARVVACLGMLGTVALAGCEKNDRPHHGGSGSSFYVARLTEQEVSNKSAVNLANAAGDSSARVRVHHGGFSGSPFYVVYLTEQEALSIIQAEAKAAGLRLHENPAVQFRVVENAFAIRWDREGGSWNPARSWNSTLSKTLSENEDEGTPWSDFLRLLKEQEEQEEIQNP